MLWVVVWSRGRQYLQIKTPWTYLTWKLNETECYCQSGFHFAPPNKKFETGMGPKNFSCHELANATFDFGEKKKFGLDVFRAFYIRFQRDLNNFVALDEH